MITNCWSGNLCHSQKKGYTCSGGNLCHSQQKVYANKIYLFKSNICICVQKLHIYSGSFQIQVKLIFNEIVTTKTLQKCVTMTFLVHLLSSLMEYCKTAVQHKLEGITPYCSCLQYIVLRAIESLLKYF